MGRVYSPSVCSVQFLVYVFYAIASMMAMRSGAEKVYALEVNSTMVAMSRKILDSNGMSGKVNLIHSLSTSLSVPRDIPQR